MVDTHNCASDGAAGIATATRTADADHKRNHPHQLGPAMPSLHAHPFREPVASVRSPDCLHLRTFWFVAELYEEGGGSALVIQYGCNKILGLGLGEQGFASASGYRASVLSKATLSARRPESKLFVRARIGVSVQLECSVFELNS